MDILSSIGSSGGNAYPDPAAPSVTAAPSTAASSAATPGTGSSAGDGVGAAAFPPGIANAPSPTPAEIVASAKDLPLNVRYAPSAAPHDVVNSTKFDRSA